MNKNLFVIIFLIIFQNFGHAFDLDMTVDDEIRKSYNPDKLVNDTGILEEPLPDLPEILLNEKNSNTKNTTSKNIPTVTLSKADFKINAGTSFDVVNTTKINDWMAVGNTVKFTNKTPIVKKHYTIPANTIFYGKILEVHQPQISGNGGLVVIRLHSMVNQGFSMPINAYVVRADGKKIFLNNIKGERTYLKTMWKKGNWGRAIFSKMLTLTINLGGEGSTVLLSPFPFAYGTICLGLNTLTSPICAFFTKGGHVSIPAGSAFRIKFLDDTESN